MPRVRMAADELDPHSRRLRHVCGLDLQPVNEAQVRAARRAYYGAVSYVDDQIGVLLAALGRCSLRRQHHRAAARRSRRHAGRARSLVQDEFLRACLQDSPDRACAGALRSRGAWRLRPRWSTSCRPCASSPAKAPAAIATPLDGNSLVPQLAGDAGRDEVIGEYLAEGAIAPLVMIKRGRYKFVHSPVDPDQLYDLLDDPDELRNLAAAAAARGARSRISRRGGAALGYARSACRGRREPAAPTSGLRCACAGGAIPHGISSHCAMRAACMCATIRISAIWKPWRDFRRFVCESIYCSKDFQLCRTVTTRVSQLGELLSCK